MKLTPMLLAKSWDVTSVIRDPDQESEIKALGLGQPGKVNVLIESLEDVSTESEAKRVLDKTNPSIVVWSAGAGGKGGPSRTKAVDEVAAKAYISASFSTPSVKKFLLVSYIGSRRGYPPWWSEEDKKASDHVNQNVLANYFKAKVEADEYLTAMAYQRAKTDKAFQAIDLRPGALTDDPGTGNICLGRTTSRGKVPREDVATVAAALLSRDDTRGWYDLLTGEDSVDGAIDALVREGFDGIEGEDVERIYARV